MLVTPFYHRARYAADLAQQLLRPTALQMQVRSGVFLSGIRRIGKTTFLRQDLIPSLESMGDLASVIFDRIVHGSESGESGLFSAEAINDYSEKIGMAVDTPQVQNMVDRMITANLIHRQSHGVYAVADPFVRQSWRQRKAMQLSS